jgi:hypothetical protein
LEKIHSSALPRWHGEHSDLHNPGQPTAVEEEAHVYGRVVQDILNPTRQGVASSRADSVAFAQLLVEQHEQPGLKSPQVDNILLLQSVSAQMTSRYWLGPATEALIVLYPLLQY